MARPSDIHFSKDSSGFYVCWMSLFMVFITTLVLALALVVHSSLNLWYQDISGSMTVQIPTYDSKGKSREKYLQEDIENVGMRFFDFVEEDHAVGLAAHLFG